MPLNPEFIKIGSDIIGAAFRVRNEAGSGLREKYYAGALAYELRSMGYQVETEHPVPAKYKDTIIDNAYAADLVVDNRVIIEVKALRYVQEAECRQLLTYLRLSDFRLGCLINFGVKDFTVGRLSDPKPYVSGIYRMVNNI